MIRITHTIYPCLALLFAVMVPVPGCSQSDEGSSKERAPGSTDKPSAAGSEWLRGDIDERFALVAKHLRGFDMAMVEVGYRYTELYWAARDRNWGYAEYQLGKIEKAIANGVERRPARAQSARMLDPPINEVREALEARDGPAIDTAFETLTTTCNAWHQAERVPLVEVAPPAVRLSPVRPGAAPETNEEANK